MKHLSKHDELATQIEINSLMLFRLIGALRTALPDVIASLEADAVSKVAEHIEGNFPEAPASAQELARRNEAVLFARQLATRLLTGQPHRSIGDQQSLL